MKIKAGNYYLNSDANQNVWITEELTNKKTGKLYERRVSGYCNNGKSALKDMIRRKVYETDTTELKEVINTVDTALNNALKILENEARYESSKSNKNGCTGYRLLCGL